MASNRTYNTPHPRVEIGPGDDPGHVEVSIYEFHSDGAPLITLDLDRDAADALVAAVQRCSRCDA